MRLVEISEEEILAVYGLLLWSALEAFSADPTYFAEMSESANLICYKRSLWEARSLAVAKAATPDEVPSLTEQILSERGIEPPRRRKAA